MRETDKVQAFYVDARGPQPVGNADYQRAFGADDGEIDGVPPDESLDCVDILGADGDALGHRGNAGIAGSAVERVEVGAAADGISKRVLSAAAADEEHFHLLSPAHRVAFAALPTPMAAPMRRGRCR